MILRGRFTKRRKVLAVVMLLVLGWMGYAWYSGIAITQGLEIRDMDWNGDGTTTRNEIAQAFYAVTVKKAVDGQRHCNSFYRRSTGEQIRVDCKTVFAAEKAAAKP
jgi:hypothetical protein